MIYAIVSGRLSTYLLLVLALASCSKSMRLYTEHEPIVFSAVASHSTKGIISTTNYPVDEPFTVKAVHYSGKDRTRTLMENVRVSYAPESGCWETEEKYLWPTEGTLRFYAVSPAMEAFCPEEGKGIEVQWTIPTEEDTQTDLCFAELTENCTRHSATVPVVFSHALSQICFKARTLKQYSFSQTAGDIIQASIINVVLDSVRIRGIVSRGIFSQDTPEWTYDKSCTTDYWVFRSKEGLPLGCDRYDVPELTRLSTMLLIPQQLLPDACIEEWHHMAVRVSQTDTTTGEIISDFSYDVPKSSVIRLDTYCKQWHLDYKYTFRLAVGLEEPELGVAVTDWTENKEIILGDE